MESATLRAAMVRGGIALRADDPDVGHLGRPFGVVDHLLGQRRADLAERGRQCAPARAAAARPLASTSTVSLVDVQPSTVMALNDTSTAARSAARSMLGSTDGVGGAQRQHGGHVGGQHGRALGHGADREPVAP